MYNFLSGTLTLSIIDSLTPTTVRDLDLPIEDIVLANNIFDETISYGSSTWSLGAAMRTALNHVSFQKCTIKWDIIMYWNNSKMKVVEIDLISYLKDVWIDSFLTLVKIAGLQLTINTMSLFHLLSGKVKAFYNHSHNSNSKFGRFKPWNWDIERKSGCCPYCHIFKNPEPWFIHEVSWIRKYLLK